MTCKKAKTGDFEAKDVSMINFTGVVFDRSKTNLMVVKQIQ